MLLIGVLSVGWVLATSTVYWLLGRGRWLAKSVMLLASALVGAGAGLALARAAPGLWPGLPFAAGAIVFTITAEALLLVWSVRRFGES
jgi:hypothetical protein